MSLPHRPSSVGSIPNQSAAFAATIGKILTTTSSNLATITGYTEATGFIPGPGTQRVVAVSILECNGAGTPVAPAGGFTLNLLRSINGGETWGIYKQYLANSEDLLLHAAAPDIQWAFELQVKGANNILVQAKGY